MSAPLQDAHREVLPRWRSLQSTIALGEHGPHASPIRITPPQEFFDMLRDWESERSLPFASEVVGSAIVFGAHNEAREAAKFVVENSHNASLLAVELANRVLGTNQPTTPTRLEARMIQSTIKSLKTEVRTDPRHAFAWAELARSYTLLGQFTKATEAMDLAHHLARNNRYILRAAARLYVHIGDPARAHHILARADSTELDPWLIASEIATARLAERESQFIREARRFIESSAVSHFDKTELASSLATLEADSGNIKRARRLFRTSLVQPNDNAVAQARWASSNGLIDLDHDPDQKPLTDLIQLPRAFEARAWYSFYRGEWENSRKASTAWYRDQPFAASPAVHASYVSSVAQQDYQRAESILRAALVANPTHPMLLNNMSYTLANLDQLDQADIYLARAKNTASTDMKPTILATSGLIAFRRMHLDEGADLYEQAIKEAHSSSKELLAAKASMFYAMEALRGKLPNAVEIAKRAIAFSSAWKNADFDMLRSRVLNDIQRYFETGERAVT